MTHCRGGARLLITLLATVLALGSISWRTDEGLSMASAVAAPRAGDSAAQWRLDEIKDPSTLDAQVVTGPTKVSDTGVLLDIWQVKFNSIDLGSGPIRAHALVVRPSGQPPRSLPALIYGNESSDKPDESISRLFAVGLRCTVIAFSGPGQGLSEGMPPTGVNWLNTRPDIRASWLYQYAYSAMRAITYVTTLPEVNPARIGMAGGSIGGVMTMLVNGVDDRLAAAVALMASGDWRKAIANRSWMIDFPIKDAGMTPSDPPVQSLIDALDPIHFAKSQRAPLMLASGAQDELFPISSLGSTWEALPRGPHRLEVVYDWDHQYFAQDTRAYGTYNNTRNAGLRMLGSAFYWFSHYLSGGPAIPPVPEATVTSQAGSTVVRLAPEFAKGARAVRFFYSMDGSYSYSSVALKPRLDQVWEAKVNSDLSMAIRFVEVEWPASLLLSFFVTTPPTIPDGGALRLRPYPGS